jgi:peroxiredoxin
LFPISTSLKVEFNMKDRTETLEVGSRAPDFSLGAANREGTFTLGGLLAQGALILEFLRGTW